MRGGQEIKKLRAAVKEAWANKKVDGPYLRFVERDMILRIAEQRAELKEEPSAEKQRHLNDMQVFLRAVQGELEGGLYEH